MTESNLRRIKLTSSNDHKFILRQTPNGSGVWGSYKFSPVNCPRESADYWIVLEGQSEPETAYIASGKIALLCHEPPDIRNYHPGFLAQFDTIVTCQDHKRHSNAMSCQPGLPWLAGTSVVKDRTNAHQTAVSADFDNLLAMQLPDKPKLISTVLSTLSKARGHRLRQRFAELAVKEIPELDVFGRGRKFVADKREAIAPYSYHLCMENCAIANYWTEKLADAYLFHAFPIYWGATNLSEYFPEGSYLQIDITRPREALGAIRAQLENGLSKHQLAALAEARDLLLHKHNMFQLMSEVCDMQQVGEPGVRTIYPERSFAGFKRRQAIQRTQRWVKARLPLSWG